MPVNPSKRHVGHLPTDLGQRASCSVERMVEVPFHVQCPGEVQTLMTGVIDLIFREGDSWVLVDWKTDVVLEVWLGEWDAYYRPQVLAYLCCGMGAADQKVVRQSGTRNR